MNRPYPAGAARFIAESRSNGFKPAQVVLISLVGELEWSNPTVYIDPRRTYRWDWTRGLCLVVLIDSKSRLGNTLQVIDQAWPYQLDVIDVERQVGWLVNRVTPVLRTSPHPKSWVKDWLGTGELHRELNLAKQQSILQKALLKVQIERQPEAVWN